MVLGCGLRPSNSNQLQTVARYLVRAFPGEKSTDEVADVGLFNGGFRRIKQ
ncbi:hypothetical protein YC2023_056868 [Brassica napus]